MCNYVNEFLVQFPSRNKAESFVIFSNPLLSSRSVKFEDGDDNRGSGR